MNAITDVKRKVVAVTSGQGMTVNHPVFRLLSELYPVDFITRTSEECEVDGLIWLEASTADLALAMSSSVHSLAVVKHECCQAWEAQLGVVEFTRSAALDPCFHGQRMIDGGSHRFHPLSPGAEDAIIATVDGRPYWLSRETSGGAVISLVALPPPAVTPDSTVYHFFNRSCWLQLLPWLNYLKHLTRDVDWARPPLRACLMFDDPNLHWPTYGFIDLRKMASHARDHNYHTAFAMIPLDTWFVQSKVAALFQEHRNWLSLCLHGNDHAYLELGVEYDVPAFGRLFAQALRRIDRFEQTARVPVARVMVPPYGALRVATAAEPMLQLGYEAVCVSRASLSGRNPGQVWPRSFGHNVGEFLEGLPVIPRQVMADGHEGTYRLAAFLEQPIIPHGHHQDCASGLTLVERTAAAINQIGSVRWLDMTGLARSNFLTRKCGDIFVVRMFSRRILLSVPEGVSHLVVERPWMSADSAPELLSCHDGEQAVFMGQAHWRSAPVAVRSGRTLDIQAVPRVTADYRTVTPPPLRPHIVARRLISELRDRLAPLIPG